jgi:hypothetical protein
MKRLHLIAASAALFLASTTSLKAAVSCSNADYVGTYAYHSTGALLQLPPQGAALVGPFAQAGTLTSDGKGNLTLETTASYNGLILPGNTTATYSVSPDCQITFFVALPDPLGVNAVFAGSISENVRQVSLMIAEPQGSILPAQQHKQDVRFCGTTDFAGAYQMDLGGSVAAPKTRAGLFHMIGRLEADGNGLFTATSTTNYNGLVQKEDFTGSYTVNSKCFVTLNYKSPAGENMTVTGPLSGHGEGASVVIASQGWAVAGNLRAQQQ